MDKCPCHSGKKYGECCARFHKKTAKPNPIELMRSRYAAYALKDYDYIMATTHPDGPQFDADKDRWKATIAAFSEATEFEGLEIENATEELHVASVTFRALLKQGGHDTSFSEVSVFLQKDGEWFYHSGTVRR